MVSIPEDELERLKDKNRRQAYHIASMQEALRLRNVDLDAMHFVWCDGGCASGVHRFTPDVILTEEMVERAERNAERLRRWYNEVKFKIAHYPTMSKWHEEYAKRSAAKTDLPL